MQKGIKYTLILIAIGLLAYNSVYFKPLHEVKAEDADKKFNVEAIAKEIMAVKIERVSAFLIDDFFNRLESDFNRLMEEGRQLGVSNQRYFMVEGKCRILAIEEENILIETDEEKQLRIATDFIFGNTLRDASGLVSISNYANTMDFNNISVEMNNYVKKKIVLPVIDQVQQGDEIIFKGAVKINSEEPNIEDLRVIPVGLQIVEN